MVATALRALTVPKIELAAYYVDRSDDGFCTKLLTSRLPPAELSVVMGFYRCGLSVAALSQLASQLPPTLAALSISFDYKASFEIDYEGPGPDYQATRTAAMRRFFEALRARPLKRLELVEGFECFMGSKGDWELLFENLPSTLETLKIETHAKELGDRGAGVLAKHLPSGLRKLDLCFNGNGNPIGGCGVGAKGALALVEAIPAGLETGSLYVADLSTSGPAYERLRAALPRWPRGRLDGQQITICRT